MATKNILLFQRIIPYYRVNVFKQLYERAGIIVCYSNAHSKSSLESYDYFDYPVEKLRRIFYKNSSTAMAQNPIPLLWKYHPEIVISEGSPSYLTLWILLLLKNFFKYKLVLWAHGVKFREMDSPFQNYSGKVKLFLFNKADAVILYSEKRKEILSKYINNPGKLFVAWNTLDTSRINKFYQKLNRIGKKGVKEELQWKRKFNLIFIGRLLPSKGLATLIDAYKLLPGEIDVALHIIGDGPEKTLVIEQSKGTRGIHIYGAVYDEELSGKYLFASDMMIIPGYIGLSIVHAFAFGCPVATCIGDVHHGPFHSPEIEYLIDGYNGIFLDNDAKIIAAKISSLLLDEQYLETLSKNAIKTIDEKANIENMIQGVLSAISYVKGTQKVKKN